MIVIGLFENCDTILYYHYLNKGIIIITYTVHRDSRFINKQICRVIVTYPVTLPSPNVFLLKFQYIQAVKPNIGLINFECPERREVLKDLYQ